jgi:hypothetical protein
MDFSLSLNNAASPFLISDLITPAVLKLREGQNVWSSPSYTLHYTAISSSVTHVRHINKPSEGSTSRVHKSIHINGNVPKFM